MSHESPVGHQLSGDSIKSGIESAVQKSRNGKNIKVCPRCGSPNITEIETKYNTQYFCEEDIKDCRTILFSVPNKR